jgi:SAM-dependent methyltransferase
MELEMNCPVCESNDTFLFLKKNNQPIHQQLINKTPEEARNIMRDDLHLVVCNECSFIFNKAFDLGKMKYGIQYDNNEDSSSGFQSYLDGLVQTIIHENKIQNCTIVEVGCGKGKFLRQLVEKGNNIGYGFDPSYKGPLTELNGRLNFKREYYDKKFSNIKTDVVLSRHVIEHIPDPMEMLKAIRKTLENSQNAKVFFETPTVLWTLKNNAVWDFGYEHCSYFTPESLTTLFQLADFRVDNVKTVFGGLYIWLEASFHGDGVIHKNPNEISNLAKQFAMNEAYHWNKWKEIVLNLSSEGKVALWGAGRKCVVFANTIDPDRKYIDGIIDIDPNKQDTYLTGTGHETFNYTDIEKRGITSAIIMNPYYINEIKKLLNENRIKIKLIYT